MSLDDIRARIDQLSKAISSHNYRYYVLDSPIISDNEYDSLFQELLSLEEKYPQFQSTDSPTQRIGGVISDHFSRILHPRPILSLSNAFSPTDLKAWYERVQRLDPDVSHAAFVVEPKIDGLTVILHYQNGLFHLGATRGDGLEGEDITANLRTIRSLPLRIPVMQNFSLQIPKKLVVRGEAFIRTSEFEKLNSRMLKQGEKLYANPRNAAAGSLRQLDSRIAAERPIDILCYSILEWNDGEGPATQWDVLQTLKSFGFPIPSSSVRVSSLDEAIRVCQDSESRRNDFSFEADGMVIKIDDLLLSERLGVSGKDPRGSIAFKFTARETSTYLLDIGINVGRTGVITPYAVLEPTVIGGATVSRATLHNFDFITDRDIRIGDRVLVKRAGDVIPYIIGPVVEMRTGKENPFTLPKFCPSCHEPIQKLEEEVAWFCVNSACPAQLIRNIEHFASRSAMEIVGLGIRIIEQLVNANIVHSIVDVYKLKSQDLLPLDGFGEKKASNLLASIHDSRNRNLPRFLYGLGIHGLGEVLSVNISEHFLNLDNLIKASLEELSRVPGIGPNIAHNIHHWFSISSNICILQEFHQLNIWPNFVPQVRISERGSLSGKQFVITGSFEKYSRNDIKSFIEKSGGKVTETVSAKTNFILLGKDPGSKKQKAEKLGVPMINISDLEMMLKT